MNQRCLAALSKKFVQFADSHIHQVILCPIHKIARSAYEYQRQVENNEKIIVGVNKFQVEEGPYRSAFRVDDSIRQVQIQKLQQLKQDRNNAKVDQCLQILNDKAAGGENLMPAVIDAVENKVTLGEIADELRGVFGEHH